MPAPKANEAKTALSPTPPSPTTPMNWPALASAVFITEPTPVTTPQPKSAACSKGIDLSILTKASFDNTEYSANPATPEWWWIDLPFWLSLVVPSLKTAFAFATVAGSQRAGRPELHISQRPQLAT